jgi:hypothetical protein
MIAASAVVKANAIQAAYRLAATTASDSSPTAKNAPTAKAPPISGRRNVDISAIEASPVEAKMLAASDTAKATRTNPVTLSASISASIRRASTEGGDCSVSDSL